MIDDYMKIKYSRTVKDHVFTYANGEVTITKLPEYTGKTLEPLQLIRETAKFKLLVAKMIFAG